MWEPKLVPYPDNLCCPITHTLFDSPVVASDGFTYSMRAISKWQKGDGGDRSPMTNQADSLTDRFVPNRNITSMIAQWQADNRRPGDLAELKRLASLQDCEGLTSRRWLECDWVDLANEMLLYYVQTEAPASPLFAYFASLLRYPDDLFVHPAILAEKAADWPVGKAIVPRLKDVLRAYLTVPVSTQKRMLALGLEEVTTRRAMGLALRLAICNDDHEHVAHLIAATVRLQMDISCYLVDRDGNITEVDDDDSDDDTVVCSLLHFARSPRVAQLLLDAWPDMLRARDSNGDLACESTPNPVMLDFHFKRSRELVETAWDLLRGYKGTVCNDALVAVLKDIGAVYPLDGLIVDSPGGGSFVCCGLKSTALVAAATSNHDHHQLVMVSALLRAGASPMTPLCTAKPHGCRNTVLHQIAYSRKSELATLDLLLDHVDRAAVSTPNANGKTPLELGGSVFTDAVMRWHSRLNDKLLADMKELHDQQARSTAEVKTLREEVRHHRQDVIEAKITFLTQMTDHEREFSRMARRIEVLEQKLAGTKRKR